MLKTQEISLNDYQRFQLFLEQACGILLGDGKQYLITSRLTKLMRDEQLTSLSALIDAIQKGSPRHLRDAVIDAMTTNETSWFRDGSPFVVLEKYVLPTLENPSALPVRMWSAACSSGQEPYTLSMLVSEYCRKKPDSKLVSCEILGTDISLSVLVQAQRALYESHAVTRGLSETRKQQFFNPAGEQWALRSEVKNRVHFKQQNLLQSYAGLGRFDIIFCRNVLIYFSAERKKDILDRLALSLNAGGFLFLGASETISGYSNGFEMLRYPEGVVYKKL